MIEEHVYQVSLKSVQRLWRTFETNIHTDIHFYLYRRFQNYGFWNFGKADEKKELWRKTGRQGYPTKGHDNEYPLKKDRRFDHLHTPQDASNFQPFLWAMCGNVGIRKPLVPTPHRAFVSLLRNFAIVDVCLLEGETSWACGCGV